MEEVWQEDPEVVRTEARSFFEKRFSEPSNYKVRLGNMDFFLKSHRGKITS